MIEIRIGQSEVYVVTNAGLRAFEALLAYLLRFSSDIMAAAMPGDGRANADTATVAYVVGHNLRGRVAQEIARQDRDANPPAPVPSVKERRSP